MFRIYKNERRDNLIVRLNLNEKIFSKIPEDPYNTLYHGKILI